jgi:hypothetical protein
MPWESVDSVSASARSAKTLQDLATSTGQRDWTQTGTGNAGPDRDINMCVFVRAGLHMCLFYKKSEIERERERQRQRERGGGAHLGLTGLDEVICTWEQ